MPWTSARPNDRRRFAPRAEALDRRELLAAFSLVSVPTASAGLAGITAAPDGSIWFAEQATGKLGKIDAAGNKSEIDLGTTSGPTGVAIGPDSNVWVTLQGANSVAKVSTTGSPTLASFPITTSNAKPAGIASTPADPAMWFAESGVGKIGRVPIAGPAAEPIAVAGDNPTEIVSAPDGSLWAVVTGADAIIRIDPTTQAVAETRKFEAGSRPTDIAVDSNGSLWVTLAGTNRVARVNPAAGGVPVYFTLSAGASPSTITAGADGLIWFVESGLRRVGRITTDGKIAEFAAPPAAGALGDLALAADGELWITAPATNQLVRLDPSQLIAVTAGPITVVGGTAAPQVVATFTSDAVSPVASGFAATIDWGDGSPPTAGRVDAAPAGGFQVVGSHTYASAGSFAARVTVSDGAGGIVTSAPTTVIIPKPLTFWLAAGSDSGPSHDDQITNVSRPVFVGVGTPYSIVQVYAARNGTQPTETRYLGQAIVNKDGQWTLSSSFLPDGWYSVSALETPPAGSPSAPVELSKPLVIDTVGPRVAGLAYDATTNHVTVVLSDVGAGLDPATAGNPAAYTIVPPRTIIGGHPGAGQGPASAPSISGVYSTAMAYTVTLDLGAVRPADVRRGRYMLQVASGGVADLAGNGLDGEFTGKLPSGNGRPGGNFIARLTVPRRPVQRQASHRRSRSH